MSLATAGSIAQVAPLLIDKFSTSVLSNFCYVTAITLILYDICITFSRELRRVWQRKITGATILFAVVRYGRVLGLSLWSIYLYSWVVQTQNQADFACRIAVHTDSALSFVINIAIAMLLAMRMCAIFQANLWVLFIILVIQSGPAFVSLYAGIGFDVTANPPPFTGCNSTVSQSLRNPQFYYGVQVAFAVLADLLLLAMTGIKTLDIRLYLKHLGVKRSYTTLLLRDGTFYYLAFLLLDVATSIQAIENFTPIQVVVQTIRANLVCHLVLNLSDVHLIDDKAPMPKDTDGGPLVSLHLLVARYILGNMGAPLITSHDDESEDAPYGSKRRLPRGVGHKVNVLDIKRTDEFAPLSYPVDSKDPIKTLDDIEKGDMDKVDEDEEDDVTLTGYPRNI